MHERKLFLGGERILFLVENVLLNSLSLRFLEKMAVIIKKSGISWR